MSELSGRQRPSDADGVLGGLIDVVASNRYASYFVGFEVALFALAAVLDTFAPNGTQTILFTNLVSGLMATFAVLMAGIVAVGLVGAGGWVALARA